MTLDLDLLKRFERDHSQDAFTELVKRHVNLVYSAALRQVRSPHLAEEITQSVFADLARNAGKLKANTVLTAWLYQVARRTAIDVVRKESRRQLREQIAMEMNLMNATAGDWTQIEPLLDDAMDALDETDRAAILLRYFENKNLREVGESLKISDDAAQKRVSRAVERLREFFTKRNVTMGASGLAVLISANAVQAAPIGLVAIISATAGTGSLTLLKIMTATKLKLGISAILVASAATALVVQHQAQEKLRTENGLLQQQIAQLQTDNANFSNQLATAGNPSKLTDDQFNELLKLRGEVGVLREQADKLNQQLQVQASAEQSPTNQISPQDQFRLQEFHIIDAMKQISLDMRIYAGNHNNQFPTNFDQITNELGGVTNFEGNISLNTFEFMNSGLVDDTMPQMISLRERTPRRLHLDDSWEREYGLADGSVQTIYSNDGTFADYEKQHSPPPNQ